MPQFGRLALHTWTVDTTPLAEAIAAAKAGGFDAVELRRIDFKRCFEQGMSNAQVLDLVRAAGMPVCTLGCEYGWLFAKGGESTRLFDVLEETCENAVGAQLSADHVRARSLSAATRTTPSSISSAAPTSAANMGSRSPSSSTRSMR